MAVAYYKNKYTAIPIWILIKVLTFGVVRDLICISGSSVKGYIGKKIVNDKKLKFKEVNNMLELLIHLRNICCHDDKLFGFEHNKVRIMNTEIHEYFKIKKNKQGTYIKGKKDLFATLIAIKCFVDKTTYDEFIDNISNLIDEYSSKITSITKKEMLDSMYLPENFVEIKKL